MKFRYLYRFHFASALPLEVKTESPMDLPSSTGWLRLSPNGKLVVCNINVSKVLYFTCEELTQEEIE